MKAQNAQLAPQGSLGVTGLSLLFYCVGAREKQLPRKITSFCSEIREAIVLNLFMFHLLHRSMLTSDISKPLSMTSLMKALIVPTAPHSCHMDITPCRQDQPGGGGRSKRKYVDNDTCYWFCRKLSIWWSVAPNTRSFFHCPPGQLWSLYNLVPRVIKNLYSSTN